MAPRTRKQFEEIRSDRRESILNAALHVFAKEGYHSASISKVSQHAMVSKGLLYNYFKSKEDLLKVLLSSLLDDEFETIKPILEKPITEDSFIRLTKNTVKTLKKYPKQWKLYLSMYSQDEVQEILKEKYSFEQTLIIKQFIQFFKDKGHDNPVQQMQYFNTVFTGIKISYILDPKNYPIDEIQELIIKQFITS